MSEQTEHENWLTSAQRDDLREGDGVIGGTGRIEETTWWNCGRGSIFGWRGRESTPGFGYLVLVVMMVVSIRGQGSGSTLDSGWLVGCNRGQREVKNEDEFMGHCEHRRSLELERIVV